MPIDLKNAKLLVTECGVNFYVILLVYPLSRIPSTLFVDTKTCKHPDDNDACASLCADVSECVRERERERVRERERERVSDTLLYIYIYIYIYQ